MEQYSELSQHLQAVKEVCTEESEVSLLKSQKENIKKQVEKAKLESKNCKRKTENLERVQKNEWAITGTGRYSREDCLVIYIPTFDESKSQNVLRDTLQFFKG